MTRAGRWEFRFTESRSAHSRSATASVHCTQPGVEDCKSRARRNRTHLTEWSHSSQVGKWSRNEFRPFDPQRHPHLDHGYAVTSYSGQGQTADRVLIHLDTELGAKEQLYNRMAYVAVPRGQSDTQILMNDRNGLKEVLSRDISRESAHQPEKSVSPIEEDVAQSLQPSRT
jgi:ATP-dependent exoDNAse (exonuclease V) alpha subunit